MSSFDPPSVIAASLALPIVKEEIRKMTERYGQEPPDHLGIRMRALKKRRDVLLEEVTGVGVE
jgi:hypothetical protein